MEKFDYLKCNRFSQQKGTINKLKCKPIIIREKIFAIWVTDKGLVSRNTSQQEKKKHRNIDKGY